MAPSTIVIRLNVFEHGRPEFVNSRPRPGVDELFLQGREERLGDRVVVTNSGAPDRRSNPVIPAEVAELGARILRAAIGVKPISV